MANIKTMIDEWEVRDLEDNSSLKIGVASCTELGNKGVPGIQVYYLGYIVNYEPLIVEQWAYKASKSGATFLQVQRLTARLLAQLSGSRLEVNGNPEPFNLKLVIIQKTLLASISA